MILARAYILEMAPLKLQGLSFTFVLLGVAFRVIVLHHGVPRVQELPGVHPDLGSLSGLLAFRYMLLLSRS